MSHPTTRTSAPPAAAVRPQGRPWRAGGPARQVPSLVAPLVTALLAALLAVLVVGAPAASAAGDDSAEPAWLRPAHLVPGLGAMDIRLSPFADEGGTTPAEDRPLLETTASYGAVGRYGAIPAGSYAASVRPAGTPVSEPPLLSLTLDLEPGRAYTVAGLGTKDQPRLERLVDDLTPPADGSASVRLLPASVAAPTVDVQAEGGPVLAQDAGLGQPTGYTVAPAGRWTVSASGAGASGEADLVLDAGTVYTLLVLDAGGSALEVRPVVDSVGMGATPVGGAETGTAATRSGVGLVLPAVAVLAGTALLVLGLAGRTRAPLVAARPRPRDAAR